MNGRVPVGVAFSFCLLLWLIFGGGPPARAFDRDASAIEVLSHEWHPDAVWERIGKTKFVWKATVRNNSEVRKRVYVYYDLLDLAGVPVARNVTNRYVDPHQTLEIIADSYIMSDDLPRVKSSRATVKVNLQ
ncbi:MAG TPA: hypothetical protein VIL61_01630 [Nitrospiria bacterium]